MCAPAGVVADHRDERRRDAETRQPDRDVQRGSADELAHAGVVAQLVDESVADDDHPSGHIRLPAVSSTDSTKASVRRRVPSILRSTLARTSFGASGAARRTVSWHERSAQM